MSIGLCCQYIAPVEKRGGKIHWENITYEKSLKFGSFKDNKYTNQHILDVYYHNLSNLLIILKRIHSEGFKSFRISSNILPLIDAVDVSLLEDKKLLSLLSQIGKFILSSNMRLTVHPDQFCVISSVSEKVINNSFKILENHAWIFDKLGLPQTPYYAINIHGGKKNQEKTLINSINKLPNNVKNRLTLENDERCYSVKDLFFIYKETGVPIVFDSHHHTFNDSKISSKEAMLMSIETWRNYKPLTHLSNTEPEFINGSFNNRRKHSNYVHYIPEHQLEANNKNQIDIDFEFKGKNIAIIKSIKEFGVIL